MSPEMIPDIDQQLRSCYLCSTFHSRIVLVHPQCPVFAWMDSHWTMTLPGTVHSPEGEVSNFASDEEAREYALSVGMTVLGSLTIKMREVKRVSKWKFYLHTKVFYPIGNLMVAYDLWCCERVRAILLWLEEWLSIPQKTVERVAIFLYFLGMAWNDTWRFGLIDVAANSLRLAVAGFCCWTLWTMHRRASATRDAMAKHTSPALRLSRVLLQMFLSVQVTIGVVISIWLRTYSLQSMLFMVAMLALVFFFYSTSIGGGGERGRRRKLAWDEIKKLFGGAAWIPKPIEN